jgi:RHS repeat-associated protein
MSHHSNEQQSVFAVRNQMGFVLQGYAFDPYGATFVFKSGANGVVEHGGDDVVAEVDESALSEWTYTGRRYDTESGLLYYRTRYLDSEMGRFISRDTIGVWGDSNSLGNGFAYAANSPMRFTDPFGNLVYYQCVDRQPGTEGPDGCAGFGECAWFPEDHYRWGGDCIGCESAYYDCYDCGPETWCWPGYVENVEAIPPRPENQPKTNAAPPKYKRGNPKQVDCRYYTVTPFSFDVEVAADGTHVVHPITCRDDQQVGLAQLKDWFAEKGKILGLLSSCVQDRSTFTKEGWRAGAGAFKAHRWGTSGWGGTGFAVRSVGAGAGLGLAVGIWADEAWCMGALAPGAPDSSLSWAWE